MATKRTQKQKKQAALVYFLLFCYLFVFFGADLLHTHSGRSRTCIETTCPLHHNRHSHKHLEQRFFTRTDHLLHSHSGRCAACLFTKFNNAPFLRLQLPTSSKQLGAPPLACPEQAVLTSLYFSPQKSRAPPA